MKSQKKIPLIIHLKEWYWKFHQNWRYAFKSEFLEIILLMANRTYYHLPVLVKNWSAGKLEQEERSDDFLPNFNLSTRSINCENRIPPTGNRTDVQEWSYYYIPSISPLIPGIKSGVLDNFRYFTHHSATKLMLLQKKVQFIGVCPFFFRLSFG